MSASRIPPTSQNQTRTIGLIIATITLFLSSLCLIAVVATGGRIAADDEYNEEPLGRTYATNSTFEGGKPM